MIMQRRSFLTGLGALFIAPAIVRASSLMPIKEYAPAIPSWCPEGWLPLDGREISKKFYPDLFAAHERLRFPMKLANVPPVVDLDTKTVNLISARDMRRASGQIMRAGVGIQIKMPVEGCAINSVMI